MEPIRFLIFDEYSMIGLRMLHKIETRCREGKGSDEPFGGLFVYFFGDLRQLPPVKDLALYSEPTDQYGNRGKAAFGSIQLKVILETSHRQDSTNQRFRDILDSVAIGSLSINDWEILMQRRQAIQSEVEKQRFNDAIRLFPTNELVRQYNERFMSRSGRAVAKISAEHNNFIARRGTDEQAHGLPSVLFLSIGCRIMLRKNLWVDKGLVNGSLGTIKDIVFEVGIRPPNLPAFLLVKFDNYQGPFLHDDLFPIFTTTVTWKEKDTECRRRQFPVSVAYALTIHKAQGLTLERAVIDIGKKQTIPGLSYVALSRVRCLRDLMIEPSFNRERIAQISKMKQVQKSTVSSMVNVFNTFVRSNLNSSLISLVKNQ